MSYLGALEQTHKKPNIKQKASVLDAANPLDRAAQAQPVEPSSRSYGLAIVDLLDRATYARPVEQSV